MPLTLKNLRRLTMEDIDRIPIECFEYFGYSGKITARNLKSDDFSIGDLIDQEEKENTYTFIHGFPDDISRGVVLSGVKVIACVGEPVDATESKFAEWYHFQGDAVVAFFDPILEQEETCEKCKKAYILSCPHIRENFCSQCDTDMNHVLLGKECIACLFEEPHLIWEYDEDLDVPSVLSDIALRVIKLGVAQKKAGLAKLSFKSKDWDAKTLYDLYEFGYDSY